VSDFLSDFLSDFWSGWVSDFLSDFSSELDFSDLRGESGGDTIGVASGVQIGD
jgi:hypothetical protein